MKDTHFNSSLVACVGMSMGDEGKGRVICEVVNEIAQKGKEVEAVIKINGGANSGHTAAGLKLNLIPAGVTDPSVRYLGMGMGVVADPRKLYWEIAKLEAAGYEVLNRLVIDERAQVSDLSHRLLDLACEHYRVNTLGEEARGSTGRGITPAYVDEVGQFQLYYSVFQGTKDAFSKKLKQRLDRATKLIQYVYEVDEKTWDSFFETLSVNELRANEDSVAAGQLDPNEFDFKQFKGSTTFSLNYDAIVDTYWARGTFLRKCITDLRVLVLNAIEQKRFIVGEFGQSYWLDKRHGFSPNVTASHAYTPEFYLSTGIPAQPVHTLGCCKAYDTKIGTHAFLTRMPEDHPLCKKLSKIEFGVSTGRQRMVGWFDAVEKGDAIRYGGADELVINKLDALSYEGDWEGGELLICVGYRDQCGNVYRHVPRDDELRKQLKPVYQQYAGWSESIRDVRSFKDLPVNAQKYICGMMKAIAAILCDEESDRVPNIRYIGVGPEPGQIISDTPNTRDLLRVSTTDCVSTN